MWVQAELPRGGHGVVGALGEAGGQLAVGGQVVAGGGLVGEQAAAGSPVDAALEPGDERRAVLGDDEGVPLGQAADLLRPQHGHVFAGGAAGPAAAAAAVAGAA